MKLTVKERGRAVATHRDDASVAERRQSRIEARSRHARADDPRAGRRRDERRRLRAAVRAWEHARPQDRGRALGRFERMRVRLLWPGTAWVPKDPKRGAD